MVHFSEFIIMPTIIFSMKCGPDFRAIYWRVTHIPVYRIWGPSLKLHLYISIGIDTALSENVFFARANYLVLIL